MQNLVGDNIDDLGHLIFGNKQFTFRLGSRDHSPKQNPLFESKCKYVTATVSEALAWSSRKQDISYGNLALFHPDKYFAYLDYKHAFEIDSQNEDFLKLLDWSFVGLPKRGPKNSTLWLGTSGAHTPLHSDTYGYNVVFQVSGRKRWTLFPWDSREGLKPTRVPYEESSVYSDINLFGKDITLEEDAFKILKPRSVILEPGDALFVPAKWWHYVESLDNSLSFNTWVELESDDLERVKEASVRCLVNLTVNEMHYEDAKGILNPNELDILSEPQGSAFSYLEDSLSRLKVRSPHSELETPNILLQRGHPVPFVFGDECCCRNQNDTSKLCMNIPLVLRRASGTSSDGYSCDRPGEFLPNGVAAPVAGQKRLATLGHLASAHDKMSATGPLPIKFIKTDQEVLDTAVTTVDCTIELSSDRLGNSVEINTTTSEIVMNEPNPDSADRGQRSYEVQYRCHPCPVENSCHSCAAVNSCKCRAVQNSFHSSATSNSCNSFAVAASCKCRNVENSCHSCASLNSCKCRAVENSFHSSASTNNCNSFAVAASCKCRDVENSCHSCASSNNCNCFAVRASYMCPTVENGCESGRSAAQKSECVKSVQRSLHNADELTSDRAESGSEMSIVARRFLMAATHPDVVELIVKKMLELDQQ